MQVQVGDLAEAPQKLVEAGAWIRHEAGAYRRLTADPVDDR